MIVIPTVLDRQDFSITHRLLRLSQIFLSPVYSMSSQELRASTAGDRNLLSS
jgi:hypothetical protein